MYRWLDTIESLSHANKDKFSLERSRCCFFLLVDQTLENIDNTEVAIVNDFLVPTCFQDMMLLSDIFRILMLISQLLCHEKWQNILFMCNDCTLMYRLLNVMCVWTFIYFSLLCKKLNTCVQWTQYYNLVLWYFKTYFLVCLFIYKCFSLNVYWLCCKCKAV